MLLSSLSGLDLVYIIEDPALKRWAIVTANMGAPSNAD